MFDWSRVEIMWERVEERMEKVFDTMSEHFDAVGKEMDEAFAEMSKFADAKKTPDGTRVLKTHTVRMLPSGIVARLTLPQDMSEKEVDELCNIIRRIGEK